MGALTMRGQTVRSGTLHPTATGTTEPAAAAAGSAARPGDGAATEASGDAAPDAAREAAWVAATREGDGDAFDALFRAYAAGLCTFVAGYVRSRAVAEEVVQELFLKIWRQRERWEVRGALRPYLYTAARHAALNHLRHERIERQWQERAVRAAAGASPAGGGRGAPEAEQQLQMRELAAAVDAAVAELPERCRAAYELSRRHHMSYAEIADVLEISPKTVENQIGIALKTLRRRVGHLLE